LPGVHLVPDRLEHFFEQRRVAIFPVHQAADVREAHIAVLQLGMGEYADAPRAGVIVLVEREVHFFDAVTFGCRTELGFGALSGSAEENAVVLVQSWHSAALLVMVRAIGPSSRFLCKPRGSGTRS